MDEDSRCYHDHFAHCGVMCAIKKTYFTSIQVKCCSIVPVEISLRINLWQPLGKASVILKQISQVDLKGLT